jgi:anti-sigma factor RsiW
MHCDEAQELITGLVDDELTAIEKAAVKEHLAECHDCTAQFEREVALKRDIRLAAQAIAVPQDLREKIASREGKLGSDRWPTRVISSAREWLATARLRPIYGFAVVALVVAAWLFQLRPRDDIPTRTLAIHESLVSGKTALVRVNDAAQLRKELTRAVNSRFEPISLNLAKFKLHPVAGFATKIANRDVLVTVYEGDGSTVTCFTFLGAEADAPEGSERFYDPDKRISFYGFSRGGVNGVMHREGDDVICILVSKISPAELLGVARGKPHHA